MNAVNRNEVTNMSRYDEFLDEVRRTRSERTYVNYCDALRCFPEGNKEEVLEYIERTDIAGSTKKLRLTILRQALLYIGGMTQDIMRLIRGYKPNEAVQPCPTDADIEILWSNLRSHRDKAIVALMAYNGLRLSEVANLTLDDLGENTLKLRDTKGKRDAVIPLVHPRVKAELAAYLKERFSDSPAIFIGVRGDALKSGGIKTMVRKEFKDNGMEFHCHSLRRYFANTLMKAGTPLEKLCKCMRHSSVTTTMKYLNIDTTDVKEALEAVI